MATTTRLRTLGLTCPHCHSEDDTLTLDLNDLGKIECTGCNETVDPVAASEHHARLAQRWLAAARWVADAPACEP